MPNRNIPRALSADFKAPSPAEAERLRQDLMLFGSCAQDEMGRRISPRDWFIDVVEDPSIPDDEAHIICRHFNGRTDLTDTIRHRIINLR
jgi:hypothetical protein